MIRRAQCEQIKLLLNAGAHINTIRNDKDSLFTEALMQKDFHICNTLLDDDNIDVLMYENNFGENVLHLLARSIRHIEAAALLKRMLKKVGAWSFFICIVSFKCEK